MSADSGIAGRRFGDRYVLAADRVFDGTRVLEHHEVMITDGKITAVVPAGC
jgi:N-acetylglucosamine-6-phosphate deacetylase